MASPLSIPSKSPATLSTYSPSASPPPLPPSPQPQSPPDPPLEPNPIPPLHHAAQINDLAYLDRYPIPTTSDGSSPSPSTSSVVLDINQPDSQGITALHWASINGHLLFCKSLLLRGAHVDLRGGDLSGTPLMWASRNGHLPIVHLLLSYSSDPTLTDAQSFNALHLAVHSSSAFLIAYLLFTLQPLAVDTVDQEGHTSLAWACYQGDAISVELLLKAGASPTRADHAGLTPLHWAVTKGNSACIKRIVEAGAHLEQRDGQGKTARDMAIELKSFSAYKRALQECGMDEFGKKEDRPLDPTKTKWAIFVLPSVGMGIMAKTFELSNSWWLGTILVGGEMFGLHHVVTKVLLGVKGPVMSERITKSNYLCSIIVASIVWVGWVWLTRYIRTPDYGTSNFLFFVAISLCSYTFYRSISMNPGYVPYGSSDIQLKETIEGLVEKGGFNGMGFCLTCLVKRPVRSKHSYATGRCVGRFDHYCPWVWNDVGVDNHRQFLIFVGSLVLGVFLFLRLSIAYFSHFSPPLPLDQTCTLPGFCLASNYDAFALSITIWAGLQLTWTVILLGVQVWQVCRQVTTLEVSNLGRYGFMGGKPGISAPHQQGAVAKFEASRNSTPSQQHLLNATGTSGDAADNSITSDPSSLSHAPSRTKSSGGGGFGFLLKLLGLDRFTSNHKALLHSHSHSHSHSHQHAGAGGRQDNPFDLGVRKNCVDFWTKGGQLQVEWNDPECEIPEGGFRQGLRDMTPVSGGNGGGKGKGRGGTREYERVALEEV